MPEVGQRRTVRDEGALPTQEITENLIPETPNRTQQG